MKFILGMVLSVASALALSSTAFAGYAKFYFGNGQSIDTEGKHSNFLISLTVKKTDMNKKLYSYDIQYVDSSVHLDLHHVYRHTNKRFFDVEMNGKVVGYGYCWRHKCHVNAATASINFEHTYMYKHGGKMIYGFGSKLDADGNVTSIWHETLKLLNPVKAH